ncbi:MAG: hypothetical protein GY733_24380 [bacterium]|nr:hypothetical protein [bacterium]
MNDDTWQEDPAADGPAEEPRESEFEQLSREIDENPGSAGFPRLSEAYRRDGQVERAEEIAKSGLARAPERLGGKVALALVMLDKGEITLASRELQAILEDVPEVPHESQAPDEAEVLAEVEEEVADEAVAEADADETLEPSAEHRLYATPLASPSDVLPHFDDAPGAPDEQAPAGEDLRPEEIDDAFAAAEAQRSEMVSANELAEAAVLDVEDDGSDPGAYRPSEHPVFTTETMAGLLEGQGDAEGAEEVRAAIGDTSELDVLDADADAQDPPQLERGLSDPNAVTVPEADVDVSSEAEEQPILQAGPVCDPEPEPLDAACAIDDIAADPIPDIPASVSNAGSERAARRQRIVAKLEGWLENLRRDPV